VSVELLKLNRLPLPLDFSAQQFMNGKQRLNSATTKSHFSSKLISGMKQKTKSLFRERSNAF
jgi:hypothetical protein